MKVLALVFLVLLLAVSAPGPGPQAREAAAQPAPAQQGGKVDEFVPSERVPADVALSFPVDI